MYIVNMAGILYVINNTLGPFARKVCSIDQFVGLVLFLYILFVYII